MSTLEFVVAADEAGKRLDVVAAARAGVSRSVASLLAVTVDGAPAAKSLRLEEGQRVVLTLPEIVPPPAGESIHVPIVYEDEHLVVVAKPAGLVVHPAPGHSGGTLVNALLARDEPPAGGEEDRPGIVHRLDAGTSGLMVVAKHPSVHERLVEMISAREVHRTYIALVEGIPDAASATIDAPIGRSSRHRKKMAVVSHGKPAITHYEIVEPLGDVSLLHVTLETGRTHQVRVHLAEIDHPIVGDAVYGRSRSIARRLQLDRPFLHAAWLAFRHPATDEELSFDEPLPEDLTAALDLAREAAPRT